jgi:hypothetical protein
VHSPGPYTALLRPVYQPIVLLQAPVPHHRSPHLPQEPVTPADALKLSIIIAWISGTRGSCFPELPAVRRGHMLVLRSNRWSSRDPFEVEVTRRSAYNIVVNTNFKKSAGHSLIPRWSPHRLIGACRPTAGPFPSLFELEW